MAQHHSPVERYQLYLKGWNRGATRSGIPKNLAGNADFQRGLQDGSSARAKALTAEAKARKLTVAELMLR